ncbi:MAG: PAS domain-containing protein [Magnetovibrio sp.]|nr:PAS domain-containing protein [Magnetovibrio sp.]
MISGKEVFFDENDLIVSKTNLKGHITYANKIFIDIAGYTEDEVLGQPHNMVRHPDMPRCVFKLLWDTVIQGTEIFAYVVNVTKTGDYYWVLAHVTASYDLGGTISGYHSTRRMPNPRIIQDTIIPLYRTLCEIENNEPNKKIGLQKSYDHLLSILKDEGIDYDEFVASLMLAA